jgi:outer membrane protein assembly factor BamB/TolA-binding protein
MARLRLLLLGLSMFLLVWADGRIPVHLFAQVPAAPVPAPGVARPPAPAPVRPPQPGPVAREMGQGGLSLADSRQVKNLRDIEKKLEKEESAAAATQIHQLLSQPQDGFFRPTGNVTGRFQSLKRQAATLLQNAAPAVRQSYELQYGAEAREKLDLARSSQDSKLAQEVTQRFLQTNAGAEACYWLACQNMDQADYFTAARYLNRLRSLSAGSRFEPRLSLRLGICWYRLGSREKALASIQEVQKTSREPIQIGTQALDKKASSEQIQAWLKSISKGVEHSLVTLDLGWQLARGTLDRNPRRQSSPPMARPLWTIAMNSWQALNRKTLKPETINIAPQLTSLKIVHADTALTPLPSTIPLVVNGLAITRYSDHLAAVDLRTGEEVWNTFERDRTFSEIRNSLEAPGQIRSSDASGGFRDAYKILVRQRAWEDLTYGTLSSDGDYVFAVEDLGFINPILAETGTSKPHPLALKDYNRLCAYDVRSGMLRWELGGANSTIKLEQAGAFFLGPPLPAGHQLYCLAEKQGFVQLLVLDAQTGRELWSQPLTQSSEDLMQPTLQASNRRRAGLTPAMKDDLLVCPTGSGYIVAVDAGTRSLAWAYQYVTPSQDASNVNGRFPRMMGGRFRGEPIDFNPDRAALTNEWQDASPILTETHVILTPRDSNELHCLVLEDGELQWKVPRGEGQYVASVRDGAVIIVNKQSVEALSLLDGKPAWPAPIPVINQTGRGITTPTHLVLPLVSGQVVSIELKTGNKFYSRVRSAAQEPLGNLVPSPGLILSQTPTELTAFRTLEAAYPEALARLTANPRDAAALAQRGEYRLSISQTAAGQDDLRESVRIAKSADAEFLLFESLLEGLQSNFATHRAAAVEAEKLARTSTQKSELYRVWAEGLRKLGEFQPAFEMLEKLNSPELGKASMERVDGFHSVRRDYWTRNELHQILIHASAADQQRYLAIFKDRLNRAKAGKDEMSLRHLTRFLDFGPVADEARLALAEQLLSKEYSLEAEQLLAGLRHHSDPKISGTALTLMIAGMIKIERGSEAASLIRELERTHSDVICYQNKTGRQLAAEWARAVTMNIGSFEDWPTGRVDVTREVMEKGDQRINIDVPIEADRGPFLGDVQMRVEPSSQRLQGLTGWATSRFVIPYTELQPVSNPMAMQAQVRNHLILLNTGLNVVALNTLTDGQTIRTHRIWSSPLVDNPNSDDNQGIFFARLRPGLGRPRFMGMDRWGNNGIVNSVQDDTLCVLRGRHLVLLDILTGETLWKRTDIVPGSEMFGDAETVFVVPPQSVVAKRIRRSDGTVLGQTPIAAGVNRLQYLGSRVLSSIADPKVAGGLILKLDDLAVEKTIWEQPFPIGTQVSLVEETDLAILEPNSLLTLIKIADGKRLWSQQLQPLTKRKEFNVVVDGTRLLLLRDEVPPPNQLQAAMAVNAMQPNLIYGQAECLDRASGKPIWSQRIEQYGLDTTMPYSSPVWFFAARTQALQGQNSEIKMLALDKRTGHVAMQASEKSYGHGFEYEIDPKDHHIDITLLGSQQPIKHRLKLTAEPVPDVAAAPLPAKIPEKPPEPKPGPKLEQK